MAELSELLKIKGDIDQSVKILNRETKKAEPIMQRDDSLMSVLSDKALYSVRLYILDRSITKEKSEEIKGYIKKRMRHRDWK
jgi:hypothetical protein